MVASRRTLPVFYYRRGIGGCVRAYLLLWSLHLNVLQLVSVLWLILRPGPGAAIHETCHSFFLIPL
ncbi:MAG: hypothetical protein ACM3MN_03320 [Nitrospirota bacterium]